MLPYVVAVVLLAVLALGGVLLPRMFIRGCWVRCFGLRGSWLGDVTDVRGLRLQVRSRTTGEERMVLPFLVRRRR
jgi:hypothetical protein